MMKAAPLEMARPSGQELPEKLRYFATAAEAGNFKSFFMVAVRARIGGLA